MEAKISDCGAYRYFLKRYIYKIKSVDRIPTPQVVKPILFIMLNPSTADAFNDDPTIRRCLGFTRRWGGHTLTVVNLFAYRATNPEELKKVGDPEGPNNDAYIEQQVSLHKASGGVIVAAWGAQPIAQRRGEYIMNHIGPIKCLGKTKSGAPKHPLFVPYGQELVDYV